MKRTIPILLFFLLLRAEAQVDCGPVLRAYEESHPRAEWEYDWTTAIFLYGALTYTKTHPQKAWVEKDVQDLFRDLRSRAFEITTPDQASLSLPATQRNGDGSDALIKLTETFFATEPLNTIGAIDHVGARHRFAWFLPSTSLFSPSALWADSVIMYVLNGYEIARRRGDEARKTFFLKQIQLFKTYLRDPSGLYKHAYYVDSKSSFPETHHWARGNLWIDLGLVEILTTLPPTDPHYQDLKQLLVDHLQALKPYATPAGLHTLIDDPDSYVETSATALLAYVLLKGQRLGLLDASYTAWAQAMTKATMAKVQGTRVTGISGPTTAFKYPFYYKYVVRQHANLSYGVGAFLLLCSEL